MGLSKHNLYISVRDFKVTLLHYFNGSKHWFILSESLNHLLNQIGKKHWLIQECSSVIFKYYPYTIIVLILFNYLFWMGFYFNLLVLIFFFFIIIVLVFVKVLRTAMQQMSLFQILWNFFRGEQSY